MIQARMIMPKLAATPAVIPVVRLMAVAMGWTAEGTVVGDAARRVRVTPLSRPQTWQMPPQPP